jgi:hypothetical protein
MIDPHHAKQVHQDYLEILDAILRQIRSKGQFQGVDTSKAVTIIVDKQKVHRVGNSQSTSFSTITPEQVDKLNQALQNPQALQGAIKIYIGNNKVYHANNGKLLTDKLGLSPRQEQSATSTTSATLTPKKLRQQLDAVASQVKQQQSTIPTRSNAVSVKQLQLEVGSLSQQIAQLESSVSRLNKGLESLSAHQEPTSVKNSRLQTWLKEGSTKVKTVAQSWLAQVKKFLVPEVEQIRKQIETVQASSQNLMESKGKEISASVKTMLDVVGSKQPDGSVTFESNSFQFRQLGNTISIKARDGSDVMSNNSMATTASVEQLQALDGLQQKVKQELTNNTAQTRSSSQARRR